MPTSGYIISSVQAARYLPGSPTPAKVLELILAADALAASWCGLPNRSATSGPSFLEASYTLYLPDRQGRGISDDQQSIFLPLLNVTAVASVNEDDTWAHASGTLVAATGYLLADSAILLYPTSSHGAWATAFRSIKVACTAGWAAGATSGAAGAAPEPLVDGLARLVAAMYHWQGKQGRSSVAQGGSSEAFTLADIPDEVKTVLAPYQLARAIL